MLDFFIAQVFQIKLSVRGWC